jgi:hypothetical protein
MINRVLYRMKLQSNWKQNLLIIPKCTNNYSMVNGLKRNLAIKNLSSKKNCLRYFLHNMDGLVTLTIIPHFCKCHKEIVKSQFKLEKIVDILVLKKMNASKKIVVIELTKNLVVFTGVVEEEVEEMVFKIWFLGRGGFSGDGGFGGEGNGNSTTDQGEQERTGAI